MKKSAVQEKKNARILVVEDENHLAEGLKLNLSLAGHDVEVATDGEMAIAVFQDNLFDLLLLDLMLPKVDGMKVIDEVRKLNKKIPILILSAKDAAIDKVKCLKLGVDDYLTKPFNLDELLLRVERILLRSSWNQQEEFPQETGGEILLGQSTIDLGNGKAVTPSGNFVLTEQERRLLLVFVNNPRKILSRDQLLKLAWGYEEGLETRTVDNFIVRLRKYFEENPKRPKHFISMRMRGYIFEP